ncbi:hypothetical protein ACWZHB_27115 [Nocardia sp. FBN12]|uniref:hypothetical protein n=1 Tax=Nocardia sp. FBN12 TaxID=3419766 RepID=UPI003CFC4311
MTDYTNTWNSPPPKFNWNPDVHGTPEDVDPKVAQWALDSVRAGGAAGVDPRLVMAIVLNEGADANLTWDGHQGELKDWVRRNTSPFRELVDGGQSNSLGLTNMKEDTFNRVKAEYPAVFANREWSDLANDQTLAVYAAAYNLALIKKRWSEKIPPSMKSEYSLNAVLAAGYNAEGFFGDYVANAELGGKATRYAGMSQGSFGRAERIMAKMFTWHDVVDPGMTPWVPNPDLAPPENGPLVDLNTGELIPPISGNGDGRGNGTIARTLPVSGFFEYIGQSAGSITEYIQPRVADFASAVRHVAGFSGGGNVQGPGSSIGDKIPAYLSDGEFVMNARSTTVNRPFLQALNADPFFLQKMMEQRSAQPSSGRGYAPSAPSGQPATVNISMSSQDDVVARLKVLAQQWELMNAN